MMLTKTEDGRAPAIIDRSLTLELVRVTERQSGTVDTVAIPAQSTQSKRACVSTPTSDHTPFANTR